MERLYHCMGHTYGTWLPGDPKGFRTRHHREHIIGDYKNPPPPGMYEERHEKAKSLMKREPVYLEVPLRERACLEFAASLLRRKVPVVIGSVDRIHFHWLAQFPDGDPRKWIGIAKRESSHYCKVAGLAPDGGLWAVRTECKPVKNERHFVRTRGYITDHVKLGAFVWAGEDLPPLWDMNLNDLLVELRASVRSASQIRAACCLRQ